MEKTLQILNELESEGLVARYAIGGALAAFFYSEAVVTEDLDAFVLLTTPSSGLVSLTPIYEFLKKWGAQESREHLVLAGTLVQVIPVYDALTEEAVRQAGDRTVGLTRTRVMLAEHLIAIALRTGRAKDHARIALLMEEAPIHADFLGEILDRHGLSARWNQFKAGMP